MRLATYTVDRNEDNNRGTMEATFEHEGDEYTLSFAFAERGTSPSAHTPFPSNPDQIYAWPTEPIPDPLVYTIDEQKKAALMLGMSRVDVPGITFIDQPYHETDEERSPFVETAVEPSAEDS